MSYRAALARWSFRLAALNAAMALANVSRFTGLRAVGGPIADPVVVAIPARDERETIGDLVTDLRAQRGVDDLRVLIYDDESTDGTGDVARAAIDGDTRFAVTAGGDTPPPAGWTGKAWALHRLTAALAATGVATDCHLCFADADVRVGPDAVARAVRTYVDLDDAAGGRLGLLTVWPRQETGSTIEALLQPLLCWSWFTLLPLARTERHLRPSTAVANGQFLVTDAERYLAVGGHGDVAASRTDDLALARTFRRAGFTSVVRAGRGDVRCRMYSDATDLRSGYSRWLASEFGGVGGALLVAAAAATLYVGPAVTLVTGPRRRTAAGALALAAVSRVLARRSEAGRLTPTDVVSALCHPFAVAGAAALVADSARRTLTHTVTWKGRELR